MYVCLSTIGTYLCMFIYIHICIYICIIVRLHGPTLRTLGGFLIICSKCNVLSVGKILKQRVLSVRMEILENILSSKCMFVTIYAIIRLIVYLFVYLSVYLYICLSICLSVYLSVCLSVCLSICLWKWSICLSVCLSICLSVCLSARLPNCLSIDPCIHLYRHLLVLFVRQLQDSHFLGCNPGWNSKSLTTWTVYCPAAGLPEGTLAFNLVWVHIYVHIGLSKQEISPLFRHSWL